MTKDEWPELTWGSTVYLDGLPIAARTLKTLDQRRQTVHRLETEPSSCHNSLPANVDSVIVKQQKDGWIAQFQREKEAYKRLGNLQGTIIPRLFGEGSLNGIPALILSEVSGSTLYELARNKTEVSEDTLQSQLQEVFSVLQNHGVEYGDLRPENFLLCDNGKIVILDLEDVSFPRETGEAPPLEDSGYLGDAGYVMSKFRDIRNPNRPSSPVSFLQVPINEQEKRQYLGPYAVPKPSRGSCYILT